MKERYNWCTVSLAKISESLFPPQSFESRRVRALLFASVFLVWAEVGFLILSFPSLPPEIPLFYSQPWGESQLAPSTFLFLLPFLSAIFPLLSSLIAEILWRKRETLLSFSVLIVGVVSETLLFLALARILRLVLPSFSLNLPAKIYLASSLAFLFSFVASPLMIGLAKRLGIVDDPRTHRHPAILHKEPIPRAGALAFFVGFIAASLLFLPITKHLLGIYSGTLVVVILGVLDDKYDLNPYLRLGFEVLAAGLVVVSGIGITFFHNPLGGIVRLDTIDIPIYFIGEHHILLLADTFALLWMVWVMNMISWSNGVDGQFSGIVFITCLVLTLLSLRFVSFEPIQGQTATLAAICGGAALGLLPKTWHPAKIFWGFGAVAPGLVIASLSILTGAKVATAVLVLLVPIIDAVVAVLRRILRGQSPVWGDRGHLHHQLLDRGFSQREIAVFYWFLTGLCGFLALITAEKSKALTLLSLGGVVGFFLVLLNLEGVRIKGLKKESEAKGKK